MAACVFRPFLYLLCISLVPRFGSVFERHLWITRADWALFLFRFVKIRESRGFRYLRTSPTTKNKQTVQHTPLPLTRRNRLKTPFSFLLVVTFGAPNVLSNARVLNRGNRIKTGPRTRPGTTTNNITAVRRQHGGRSIIVCRIVTNFRTILTTRRSYKFHER